MCSAVRRRMLEKGTTRSVGMRLADGAYAGSGAGGGTAHAARRGRRWGGRGRLRGRGWAEPGAEVEQPGRERTSGPGPAGGDVSAPEARASTTANTSSRVMRPPRPVPVDLRRVDAVVGQEPPYDRREEPGIVLDRPAAVLGPPEPRPAPAGAAAPAELAESAAPSTRGSAPAGPAVACTRVPGEPGMNPGGGGGGAASGAAAAPSVATAGDPSVAGGGRRGVADHGQPGADVHRVALLDEDLGEHARRRGRGPRSRPCPSTPRTGARPG